jgi:hypothetical protein
MGEAIISLGVLGFWGLLNFGCGWYWGRRRTMRKIEERMGRPASLTEVLREQGPKRR